MNEQNKEKLFDTDNIKDKLLEKIKSQIGRIVDLEGEWKIKDLVGKSLSKVCFIVGSLLQRDIEVYQRSAKYGDMPWKSATTITVTKTNIIVNFSCPGKVLGMR